MLQTMMQQNMLLYGIGILSFLGVVSQIWLWGIYSRMTKDMENERAAKGKFIKQIRQRYGLLKRMGGGEVNTQAFIKRSLYQYRHLGRNLHQWRRMGAVALGLSIIMGAVGYYYARDLHFSTAIQQNYLWAVGIASVVMAVIYGITDVRYRRAYLETGLLDMLENTGGAPAVQKAKAGIGRDAEEVKKTSIGRSPEEIKKEEERTFGPIETAAAAAEKLPFRKNKKGVQTKAQQEKKELKENISRIKASIGESAAGAEKERNAEILKNMDAAEQERIIREVLKEFLS